MKAAANRTVSAARSGCTQGSHGRFANRPTRIHVVPSTRESRFNRSNACAPGDMVDVVAFEMRDLPTRTPLQRPTIRAW
jgi:hypothetical protein